MAEGLYQAVLTLPDAYHISVSEEDIDKYDYTQVVSR